MELNKKDLEILNKFIGGNKDEALVKLIALTFSDKWDTYDNIKQEKIWASIKLLQKYGGTNNKKYKNYI